MAGYDGNKAAGKHRGELDRRFARFDVNGDGLIAHSEFPAGAALFEKGNKGEGKGRGHGKHAAKQRGKSGKD